ncbi:MAG: hypothetical protein KME25_27145 [Symplocastrum torsivum CPER-KK1]|jgi:hypothetical protein|uniref:Uncharacterized protein n=1 Tax=Symplocastrum torsivum CPER-KK1 TaxID=450513 RepID=A0A951UDV0_9CYAN|nr:ABC transporter permease [Microcoleus sp. FACHB-SPT15]MBD1809384.1 ABC transporter permease [Microcoleus sp. FACHB-SPT15]MBW4548086.1 hypothetical protein [Symplocastrum torsivum CPER-KK1]
MRSNLAIFIGTLLLFIAIVAAAIWGYILSLLFRGFLTINPQTVLGTLILFITVVLLICVLYFLIKRQRTLALRRVTPLQPPPTTLQPLLLPRDTASQSSLSSPSPELQNQLYSMLGGDRERAERLVNQAKNKHPGMSEDWYWEKAIADLGRDRR